MNGRWLLAVAAPAEARAVLRGLGGEEALAERAWELHESGAVDVVVTGIGKVNAAGAVARVVRPERHSAVVSVGVAGALPIDGISDAGFLRLGTVVAATESVYADEGLETPEGFRDCEAMGFPMGPFEGGRVKANPAVFDVVRGLADVEGAIATVSTCSGTDALARRVRERTGAVAEAMEGAAVAHVCARVGVASGELRVVSNTCGERGGQRWDLKGALARLEGLVRTLAPRVAR